MFDLLPFLTEQLQLPSYLHLVLQPFLIHGLFLCALFVLGSLVCKQKLSLAIALILTALCAACIFPYLQSRTEAVTAIQLAQGEHLASEVKSIAVAFKKLSWIYYALSGLALITVVTIPAKKKIAPVLSVLVVIWSLYASGLALAYHHRDSRLYHPNLMAPGEVVVPKPEIPAPDPEPMPLQSPTSTPAPTSLTP